MKIAIVAREEIVHVTDDLDGTEATTSLRFAVDGVEYVIDLSEKNAAKSHKALAPYVDAARPFRPTRTTKRTGAKSSLAAPAAQDGGAIRSWAVENGFEVSSRGRIPRTVVEAFRAAH